MRKIRLLILHLRLRALKRRMRKYEKKAEQLLQMISSI